MADDQTDAARSRVEQHRVSFLDLEGARRQVTGGESFQHHRGRLLVGDPIGNGNEPLRRHDSGFRIGSGRAHRVSDAIARLDHRHAVAHRVDDAAGLHADAAGERHLIDTTPLPRLYIVQADRGLRQPGLARTGFLAGNLLPSHDLGASVFMYPDCVRHGLRSCPTLCLGAGR